jgi:hypothetical protein
MEINVLNLGAGVQSTTLYLLDADRKLEQRLDWTIFADTQEEPQAVYDHLQWMVSLGVTGRGCPILIRTKSKLGDDLIKGQNGDGRRRRSGGRFASIPAFTAAHHEQRSVLSGCDEGRIPRQCTREYKIEVVERAIRREVLKLRPRQHIPKDVLVRQFFGISWDERHRAIKIAERLREVKWCEPVFPLIDRHWTREKCQEFLKDRVPHKVPRSACTFCPFRSDQEWLHLKQTDSVGFARAVEIDRAIRDPQPLAGRGLKQSLYLHRKCIPLEMVDFEAEAKKQPDLFALYDCGMGMCGV